MLRFIIFGIGLIGLLVILILMIKESIKVKKQRETIENLNIPELLENTDLNLNEFLKANSEVDKDASEDK